MMGEAWKAVEGYEVSYEVSNLGRVKSLDRMVRSGVGKDRRVKGRMLKPYSSNKSPTFTVKLCADGGYVVAIVSHLVWAAFIGDDVPGYVGHKDTAAACRDAADNLMRVDEQQRMLVARRARVRAPVVG